MCGRGPLGRLPKPSCSEPPGGDGGSWPSAQTRSKRASRSRPSRSATRATSAGSFAGSTPMESPGSYAAAPEGPPAPERSNSTCTTLRSLRGSVRSVRFEIGARYGEAAEKAAPPSAGVAPAVPAGYAAVADASSDASHTTRARHAGIAGTPSMGVVEETSSFAADVSFVCFLTAFACAFASAFASAASAAAPSGSLANRGALWTARRSGSHRFSCHVSAYSYRPSVSSASPRG
mmetsp:Transcript_2885/g.11901  ORF Transcript_2885/g.11901 Transcript_2885/m.11901 type:complete len:234 (-) Transcript_2885:1473-2174(-)